MLEERLEAANTALVRVHRRVEVNAARITRAVKLYDHLGTRPLGQQDELGNASPLATLTLDPSLPWETRLENLRRIAQGRQMLYERKIPYLRAKAPQLDREAAERERERQNALAEIHVSLLSNRRQVIDNVRAGWLRRDDVVWVDSLISGYGFPEPQPESLPTPKLDEFAKITRNKEPYLDFLKSPQFAHLLRCLSECLDQEGQISTKMMGSVLGYIFERKVATLARSRLATKTKDPFVVISPDDTFELFMMANRKRKVEKRAYGLQTVIEGIPVPDMIIVFPKGTEARVMGVGESTMAKIEGNVEKERQVDFYEASRGGMADLTKTVFDYYNNSSCHPLAKYPDLAGRQFVVAGHDQGFTSWYFVPQNAREVPGVDRTHVIKTGLNITDLSNFARALVADYSREYLAFGDLLNTTSPEAFRKLLVH